MTCPLAIAVDGDSITGRSVLQNSSFNYWGLCCDFCYWNQFNGSCVNFRKCTVILPLPNSYFCNTAIYVYVPLEVALTTKCHLSPQTCVLCMRQLSMVAYNNADWLKFKTDIKATAGMGSNRKMKKDCEVTLR